MNSYSLRNVTAGLMIAATLCVYCAGLLCCTADIGLQLYNVGYLEPPLQTINSLAIAIGRPAIGWLVVMSILFPLWAISPKGNPS